MLKSRSPNPKANRGAGPGTRGGLPGAATRGWLALLLAVGMALAGTASGADAESRAFNAAAKALQDGFAERAEREFADFVQKHPASPRVPDALLLQARAAFACGRAQQALSLLGTNQARAGMLADQYSFWLGQIQLESTNYAAAAAAFKQLLAAHPQSSRCLEASYGEALARFRLGDWKEAGALLQRVDGAFQQAARAGGNPDLVARGQLLLGEALLKQQEYAAAEAVAKQVATNLIETAWSRQYLLCRIQTAAGWTPAALAGSSNLVALAGASARPTLLAQTQILQGDILQQVGQPDAALAAYDLVQNDKMPEAQRREAFLRTMELMLSQGNLAGAAARLERLMTVQPEDASSDGVLLVLGELRLREHYRSQTDTNAPGAPPAPVAATNRLQQALICFDRLIEKHPQSPLLGKACLNRGWVLLADGKVLESQAAFQMAAEKLPLSEQQAVARFKLADTQFLQNDFTNAQANYRKVIEDYGGFPRVRTGLFDRAWYQIARLCLRTGNLNGASDAIRRILAVFPASHHADRGLLLYGQELNQTNRSAEARAIFAEYLQRFTNSALIPEAQMGLARSFEIEADWPRAIGVYEDLLGRFPGHPAAPAAHYFQACAYDHAGQGSNALSLLTNFLARFPTHSFAPRAQDWIGDFHYRNQDFAEAERNYQRLFQNTNWQTLDLAFEARLKAGRAAVMRQGYADAVSYFTNLINDKQCPASLVAEAFFAYGDTLISRSDTPEITNAMARYETAVKVFRKIPQLYPGSPLVPPAYGRMGDCYSQMATLDPQHYTNAVEFYRKAMSAPGADAATRSQAEIALAGAELRQGQLLNPPDPELVKSALDHNLNVVYGRNLERDETPVPLWVKEGGLAAGRILESQKNWDQAIRLYGTLQQMLPALRPALERRIAVAREQADRNRP